MQQEAVKPVLCSNATKRPLLGLPVVVGVSQKMICCCFRSYKRAQNMSFVLAVLAWLSGGVPASRASTVVWESSGLHKWRRDVLFLEALSPVNLLGFHPSYTCDRETLINMDGLKGSSFNASVEDATGNYDSKSSLLPAKKFITRDCSVPKPYGLVADGYMQVVSIISIYVVRNWFTKANTINVHKTIGNNGGRNSTVADSKTYPNLIKSIAANDRFETQPFGYEVRSQLAIGGRLRDTVRFSALPDGYQQRHQAERAQNEMRRVQSGSPKRPSRRVFLGGQIALLALGCAFWFWVGYQALSKSRNASVVSIGLAVAISAVISGLCLLDLLLSLAS